VDVNDKKGHKAQGVFTFDRGYSEKEVQGASVSLKLWRIRVKLTKI
jgi:hypothetical protein